MYNLKVVLHQTGIKPDTLRAWERRYGLPQPKRTSGGHRLYSLYDIEMIKWLIRRQEEGMRINRAIDLWLSLEAGGKDPLDELQDDNPTGGSEYVCIIEGLPLEKMRVNWVSACMAYDEATAERILAQSFALYPLESVCIDVIQKGISDIGWLWYIGEATVQQEHFASNLALRRLNALIAATPPPTRDDRIIVACPPEEEHIFPSLLITLFLRQRGWDVVFLGANVPEQNLEKVVQSSGTRVVILTATQLYTAAHLAKMAQYLHEKQIIVAFGGPIFNRIAALKDRITGHFMGEPLDRAVQTIENMFIVHPNIQEVEEISDLYRVALKDLIDNKIFLDAGILDPLQMNGIDQQFMQSAIHHLGRNILAALYLGDLNFLQYEIEWLATLFENYGLPKYLLGEYMDIFGQPVVGKIPDSGITVIQWLETNKYEWIRS